MRLSAELADSAAQALNITAAGGAGNVTLYTVQDIQRIFKLGRTKSYELMNSHGFPAFRINTKLYVEKKSLEKWIESRKGRTFSTK